MNFPLFLRVGQIIEPLHSDIDGRHVRADLKSGTGEKIEDRLAGSRHPYVATITSAP